MEDNQEELNNNIKVKNLKNYIDKKNEYLKYLEKEVSKVKHDIKEKKEKIWSTCNHIWVPDRSYNNYDHTPYYCIKCFLN